MQIVLEKQEIFVIFVNGVKTNDFDGSLKFQDVFWGEDSPYKMTIIRQGIKRQGLLLHLILKCKKLHASFGMGAVNILLD